MSIPSKDYLISQGFYQADFANNLMLQLAVVDINQAFAQIATLQGFAIKYQPIKTEPWAKVIYLWGPADELWHLTQFNYQQTKSILRKSLIWNQ